MEMALCAPNAPQSGHGRRFSTPQASNAQHVRGKAQADAVPNIWKCSRNSKSYSCSETNKWTPYPAGKVLNLPQNRPKTANICPREKPDTHPTLRTCPPPPSPVRGATFSASMACLATKNQPKQPTFAQEKNQPPIPALRTFPLPPAQHVGQHFPPQWRAGLPNVSTTSLAGRQNTAQRGCICVYHTTLQ